MLSVSHPGPNQTILRTGDGMEVLFSYSTPVAAFIPGRGYVRTRRQWSKTTSKHINAWARSDAEIVDQDFLDNLIKA